MSSKRSPLLAGSQSAVCWFRRDNRNNSGQWVTTVKCGDRADTDAHRTQREACEFIGLADQGSADPEFRPPSGETGVIRAV
jgi:hypothetical protein